MRRRTGFTLIELTVVVCIISVLSFGIFMAVMSIKEQRAKPKPIVGPKTEYGYTTLESVQHDGHFYVVATTSHSTGGINIIHSESCPCRTAKAEQE